MERYKLTNRKAMNIIKTIPVALQFSEMSSHKAKERAEKNRKELKGSLLSVSDSWTHSKLLRIRIWCLIYYSRVFSSSAWFRLFKGYMESLRNKMFQDGSRLMSLESIDAKSQVLCLTTGPLAGGGGQSFSIQRGHTDVDGTASQPRSFQWDAETEEKACFWHVSNIHGNGFCIPWGVVGFPPSRFWWCCWHQRIFDRSWEAGESASFQKCWLSGVTLALAWDSDSGGVRDTGTAFPLEAQWCCGSVKTDLLSLSHFLKIGISVVFFPKMVVFQIWELYLFLWSSSSWWMNWFANCIGFSHIEAAWWILKFPVQRWPCGCWLAQEADSMAKLEVGLSNSLFS